MKTMTIFVLTAFFSYGANAACNKPEAPVLPDADTAVTAQMVKAKNDVTQFLKSAESYLNCISNIRKHNAMVKEMHELGDGFNEIVRTYKARKSAAS